MNQSKLVSVAVAILGLFLALALLLNSLTSGHNMIGELYKFIPIVFAIVGFAAPMQSTYLLFFCGAFMGYLKKVMVLDGYYGFLLQYLVVGAPAILVAAMCAGTLVQIAFNPKSTKRDWIKMLSFIVLSAIVVAFLYLKAGAIQIAIMGGVYINAAWVVEYQFREKEQLHKLIKFIITILLFSSLFGFYQWIFGLTYLDLEYLQYGYEAAAVNIVDARPFATYGESGHFGYAMLFAVTLLVWIFTRARNEKNISGPARILFVLLITVASLGVVCSLKKAPILSLAILPFTIFCLRRAWVSVTAASSLAAFVLASIFYGDAIRDWCREASETTTQLHPALTLNTINTRIKSFEQIGDPESGIKWFGGGDDQTHSHTAITDILIVVGYGPAIVVGLGGFLGYLIFRVKLGRMLGGWDSSEGRQVAILIGYFLAFAAATLMGTNSFQAFPGSLTMWIVFGFSALVLRECKNKQASENMGEVEEKGYPKLVAGGAARSA